MPELLVEYRSEEIPARMQRRAADELVRLFEAALKEANLDFEKISSYATPRRLVLQISDVPVSQPPREIERKGPRTDAPEKALAGFLGSVPVTIEQCETHEDKKGTFYVARWTEGGGLSRDVLSGIVRDVTLNLSWPKSMRWSATTFRWVRPLHGILAVFDGAALAGSIDTGDGELVFSDRTCGHRFMAPDEFSVSDFSDYTEKLRAGRVLVDDAERQQSIRTQMADMCATNSLEVPEDDALYREVCGLVEWPTVLLGTIDSDFMELPREVLTTSMREHQKYFAISDGTGGLRPKFAFVSNVETEHPEAIVSGNERVLRARLSDAKYFWDLDLKTPLEDRVSGLDGIVFHAKLGSVGDKVSRVVELAAWLSEFVDGASRDAAERAARLAKADLVTGMVGEFPELQGVMGRYYAHAQNEPDDIADAIAQHYAPLGPTDQCPTAPISTVVALADKLDTLVGFWSIDEKPTGSKDPFALRRAALGVIRILLENRIRLDLRQVFEEARRLHDCAAGDLDNDLLQFFADRLNAHLRDEGTRHDHIGAVFALPDAADLVGVVDRVRALGPFLMSDDGANLLTTYRRASNIVRAEEKKDSITYSGDDYEIGSVLQDSVEVVLAVQLDAAEPAVAAALMQEDFAGSMQVLAGLRGQLDDFFDQVTVNVDDSAVRANRLRLLARIQEVMNNVADFSKVEG
ncbi:MAG: glycine--tRNA ligase subunit beta [Alphaproteobacteria bacterium]|nr:glycine--tRNA ligase subunit beta [Alphaproteobacteria bacterium]